MKILPVHIEGKVSWDLFDRQHIMKPLNCKQLAHFGQTFQAKAYVLKAK